MSSVFGWITATSSQSRSNQLRTPEAVLGLRSASTIRMRRISSRRLLADFCLPRREPTGGRSLHANMQSGDQVRDVVLPYSQAWSGGRFSIHQSFILNGKRSDGARLLAYR